MVADGGGAAGEGVEGGPHLPLGQDAADGGLDLGRPADARLDDGVAQADLVVGVGGGGALGTGGRRRAPDQLDVAAGGGGDGDGGPGGDAPGPAGEQDDGVGAEVEGAGRARGGRLDHGEGRPGAVGVADDGGRLAGGQLVEQVAGDLLGRLLGVDVDRPHEHVGVLPGDGAGQAPEAGAGSGVGGLLPRPAVAERARRAGGEQEGGAAGQQRPADAGEGRREDRERPRPEGGQVDDLVVGVEPRRRSSVLRTDAPRCSSRSASSSPMPRPSSTTTNRRPANDRGAGGGCSISVTSTTYRPIRPAATASR